jgi:hypothetical protein
MKPALASFGSAAAAQRVLALLSVASAGLLMAACGSSATPLPSFSLPSLGHGGTASPSAAAGSGPWSSPVKVDSTDTAGLTAVSCVSSSFCVAVDAEGNAFTYSSGTWSAATNIDSAIVNGNTSQDNLQSISCASTTFCVAGDAKNNVMVYNGSTWSAPQSVDPQNGASFFSVSCPTTSFCLAVDGNSNFTAYNGTTWSSAQPVDPNSNDLTSELTSVSCASATFCVASDGADDSITYNGTAWGQPQTMNTPGGQQPVVPYIGCATTTLCLGVGSINDTSEYLVTYNGSNWSSPVPAQSSPDEYIAVSCSSAPFCMVLEAGGHDVTYDGSTWSHPQQIEPLTEDALPTAISCTSGSFCLAVDSGGNALIWTP